MKTKLLLVLLSIATWTYAQPEVLMSPNGNIKFSLQTDSDGELVYAISYKDKPVILNSFLGISGWDRNLEIEDVQRTSFDTVWKPVYGERAEVRDHYNQQVYVIKTGGRGDRLHVIVRAYDEGIGFRYKYAGSSYLRITSEKTTFCVPQNT